MTKPEPKKLGLSKFAVYTAISAVSLAVVFLIGLLYSSRNQNHGPVDLDAVEKLKAASHVRSAHPAQRQTLRMVKRSRSSLRLAALNAVGMERREVSGMASGDPIRVFSVLSHLGGLGEIIWVDQWTNFPVTLPVTSRRHPSGLIEVPRRDAVRAALDAIEASGGCLVRAGKDRYLVAKVIEKEKYEVAIRALGWLDGNPPPWEAE